MSDLEWRPILTGAAVAAVAAVIVGLSLRLISESSNLGFVAFAVIMAGMTAGGFIAARPQTPFAFTSGAAAGFVGSLAAQLLSLLVQLARGTTLPNGYLVGAAFTLLISSSFGILGGYVALRRDRTSDPSSSEEASA